MNSCSDFLFCFFFAAVAERSEDGGGDGGGSAPPPPPTSANAGIDGGIDSVISKPAPIMTLVAKLLMRGSPADLADFPNLRFKHHHRVNIPVLAGRRVWLHRTAHSLTPSERRRSDCETGHLPSWSAPMEFIKPNLIATRCDQQA